MTELSETRTTAARANEAGFASTISRAMMRRLLVTLSATAATAATAYLTRKGAQLWEEEAKPKIREKGGSEALMREAVAKVSELFDSASTTIAEAEPVAALTEKVEAVTGSGSPASPEETKAPATPSESDPDREKERRERRKRREQRQRALRTSGST